MKKIIILFIAYLTIQSCSSEKVITEREIFKQKLEAFQFLSKYHHQLHIMIGEEDGNPEKAFYGWPINNGGDAAVLYCFIFLFIAAMGSGIWSIDNKKG